MCNMNGEHHAMVLDCIEQHTAGTTSGIGQPFSSYRQFRFKNTDKNQKSIEILTGILSFFILIYL